MNPQRHERLGWGLVCFFGALGLLLETMHGLKWGPYLDAAHAPRRLLWTLAHAHGVLLGLVNLAFASLLRNHSTWSNGAARAASVCMRVAGWLTPWGFLLGGAWLWGSDPNPLVLLSPVGGVALVTGAFLAWRRAGSAGTD